jgi:hypothetical protein
MPTKAHETPCYEFQLRWRGIWAPPCAIDNLRALEEGALLGLAGWPESRDWGATAKLKLKLICLTFILVAIAWNQTDWTAALHINLALPAGIVSNNSLDRANAPQTLNRPTVLTCVVASSPLIKLGHIIYRPYHGKTKGGVHPR